MSLCRDGGACCLHKEDDVESGTGVMVSNVDCLWERSSSLRQASYTLLWLGVPAKPIQGIDRYFNKAGRQICLSDEGWKFMTVLSVVIPAYNEEKGIAEIACRVLSVAPDLKKAGIDQLELLIVDDGSGDRTAEVASKIPGVNLICHPRNRGYGAALKTGFSKARGATDWFFGCRRNVSAGVLPASLPRRYERPGSGHWITHGR